MPVTMKQNPTQDHARERRVLDLGQYSPPFDEGLDQRSVALSRRQVQEGHSPEGLGMNEVLGFHPAGATHHLLANQHHAALKGTAGHPRRTLHNQATNTNLHQSGSHASARGSNGQQQ